MLKLTPKDILSNPYCQSFFGGGLIVILVAFIWDAPIEKFNLQIDPFTDVNRTNTVWIAGDFNGDGSTERIRCFRSVDETAMDVVHYDENGDLTDHFHFHEGAWSAVLKPSVFDINSDGTSELLFFYIRNDSIFFNAFNLARFKFVIKDLYFKSFEQKRKQYAYRSEFYCCDDWNEDGKKELLFRFDSGFGLYPRGIFKLDFANRNFTASPTEYMVLAINALQDVTGDGRPEIFVNSTAPSNVSAYKKYTDTISYIVVLDLDLNFVFEPIPFAGEFSTMQTIPDTQNDTVFYAIFYSRSDHTVPLELMTVNFKGEIVKRTQWTNFDNPETLKKSLYQINKKPYLMVNKLGAFKLTPNHENVPLSLESRQETYGYSPLCIDLNQDGTDEVISWNQKDVIAIRNLKAGDQVIFEAPIELNAYPVIYPFYTNGKLEKHMFTCLDGFFFFKYERNPYYFVLYLVYCAIFIVSFGFIFGALYVQKRSLELKWLTEKHLQELQFNAVKNQLNPHFLFNALNSVALMINEGRNGEAYDFLTVNSRLIQRVLNDAKEVKCSLESEIRFTRDYISIQKHRFKDRFEVHFAIHPDVDLKFEVPKMCLHTYVENAIKHGFRHTQSGGIIEIRIDPLYNGVYLSVSDNGQGIQNNSPEQEISGNGLRIMNEYYQLFEKYYGYQIKCKIHDRASLLKGKAGMNIELWIKGGAGQKKREK